MKVSDYMKVPMPLMSIIDCYGVGNLRSKEIADHFTQRFEHFMNRLSLGIGAIELLTEAYGGPTFTMYYFYGDFEVYHAGELIYIYAFCENASRTFREELPPNVEHQIVQHAKDLAEDKMPQPNGKNSEEILQYIKDLNTKFGNDN